MIYAERCHRRQLGRVAPHTPVRKGTQYSTVLYLRTLPAIPRTGRHQHLFCHTVVCATVPCEGGGVKSSPVAGGGLDTVMVNNSGRME